MAKKDRKAVRSKAKAPRRKARSSPGVSAQPVVGMRASPPHESAESGRMAEESVALPNFPVVGIGASAGGLEACTELLENLPAELGAALIIVQHMFSTHESMLKDLLRKSSKLPVAEVTDGMRIELNRVHVIPPGTQMALVGGRLLLTRPPEDSSRFKPIDFFFRSMAAYAQSRAIGVVLSGTDGDGAVGIRDIKGAAGITIAQEPRSARYDGMPRASIATGMIDLVLPPSKIAGEVVRIAQHPYIHQREPAEGAETTAGDQKAEQFEQQLQRIFTMLRNAAGVDFTHYKRPTIRRRLHRRMVLHKVTSVDEYIKLLQRSSSEVHALYHDLLIHVTRFFRDPESFQALVEMVFPKIIESRSSGQPIRVWVPGCSTGEEAYTAAIALREFLGDEPDGAPVQIFATDVSEAAVEHARAGVYPGSIATDVSVERLRRFFNKTDGNYRVAKAVRDMCIFARQDLTRDPPFSKLDLILCRNVLIYLGPMLQRKLMTVFHYALRATGYLMLGQAETIGVHSDLFAIADKRYKLFSKKVSVPRMDMMFPALDRAHARPEVVRRAIPDARTGATVQTEANRQVLARYAPPGVIVDADLQIVQFRGQTGPYLEPAPGEASLNLLKMAREGLLFGLRSALQEAHKTGRPVRREGRRVKHNGSVRDVNVEVIPLEAGEGKHYLVLFEDVPTPLPAAADDPAPPDPKGAKTKGRGAKKAAVAPSLAQDERRVRQLQEELAASREHLQSNIQDLEAANEELQSANEEILSANEELQSTNEELDTAKEELQSTNEELNTVNEELQARNEELSRVNSDLINLLASVQIAIVMVAGDLRIRRFTPMAEKVLNLIPTDVGRPISDIKPNIEVPDLERVISEVIETVMIQEREVRARDGTWYTLRVRPYKNVENRIDGAVLALLDSADTHRQEGLTDDARDYAAAIIDTVHEPILVLDDTLKVQRANRPFYDRFQLNPSQVENRMLPDVADGRFGGDELRARLQQMIATSGWIQGVRLNDGPDGNRRVVVSGRVVRTADAREPTVILAVHDTRVGEADGAGP
ncbi:MAG TPA: chemotaxis protein CheB [Tepidisphaeraceae bacterium]|jgi:two-component system CheB/CheR fusion protein